MKGLSVYTGAPEWEMLKRNMYYEFDISKSSCFVYNKILFEKLSIKYRIILQQTEGEIFIKTENK